MPASKLRRAVAPSDRERDVDMSPMIDMVFLLLIFFIVNATAIIVQTDPEVKPPIAANSQRQVDGQGRIVVNIREDGSMRNEANEILDDEEAVYSLVRTQRERIEQLGVVPKLHLRGDKETVFRHSRTVIRGAARAGVDQVVFAVFLRDPGY